MRSSRLDAHLAQITPPPIDVKELAISVRPRPTENFEMRPSTMIGIGPSSVVGMLSCTTWRMMTFKFPCKPRPLVPRWVQPAGLIDLGTAKKRMSHQLVVPHTIWL